MVRKFYLISGHSSTGELVDVDKEALGETDNKNVLVLNLSFDDPKRLGEREVFFRDYFASTIKADNIAFINPKSSEQAIGSMFRREIGLVYLPGGDTKTLLRNLKQKGLVQHLQSFEGIISGNSAGAYACCPEYLRIGHGPTEVISSLGLIKNTWIKAHYKKIFDNELLRLSESRIIYALENSSALVFTPNLKRTPTQEDVIYKFIGKVLTFHKGKSF